MPSILSCPTCGKGVVWEPASRWRPFCSDRCRLLDLGDWLSEAHHIPGEAAAPDSGLEFEQNAPEIRH